ncbi:hypothetical protein AU476_16045 [Cupriavidus sp. UYMSc13B]|nr:hypothetical protein AU476_16045 [Cupriavidus sp. UYMSc13B]
MARAFCFQARIARACPSSDKCLQAVGAFDELLPERRKQGVEADAFGDAVALQVQQGQGGLKAGAGAQDVVSDFEDVVLEGDGLAGWGRGGFGLAAELSAVALARFSASWACFWVRVGSWGAGVVLVIATSVH